MIALRNCYLCLVLIFLGATAAIDVAPFDLDDWASGFPSSKARRTAPAEPWSAAFDVFPSQNWNDSLHSPKSKVSVEHLRYSSSSFGQSISANIFRVENPKGHYSVVEPLGGCQARAREYTSITSEDRSCIVATNAGFFDPRPDAPTYGQCLGNVISLGRMVQKVSHKNVAFGMLKNGSFIVGMLPAEFIGDGNQFHTLVNGVIWLVRNNASYVAQSLKLEDGSTQYTSSLRDFATVVSARTAVGHDALGRLVLVTIDGKTWTTRGINLFDFADFLLSLGVVNAINLDGGGSATAVVNGTVVSMPSDPCPSPNEGFSCERKITTVNCVYSRSETILVVDVELKVEMGWSYVWLAFVVAVGLAFLARRAFGRKRVSSSIVAV